MYHALHPDGRTGLIDAEDLPYAISESDFLRQLDVLGSRHCGALPTTDETSAGVLPEVIITFDDGHVSNHQIALPLLLERGLIAHVFVTSGFIGQRRGFCSPEQVAEMAHNGLLIGAHGVSHTFFDDMTPEQAAEELQSSRASLERWTEDKVTTMSFPGGRFSAKVLELAGDAGYDRLFGSKFGMVCENTVLSNRGQVLERVPVRRTTTLEEFRLISEGDEAYFNRARRRQSLKDSARRLLGNKLYHGLYKTFG